MKIMQQSLVSHSTHTSGIEKRPQSRSQSQTIRSAIADTNPILMRCQVFQAWFAFPSLQRLVIMNWRLCANRKGNMSPYRFPKEAWSSRKKLPDTTSTITTTVTTITITTIIIITINLGSTSIVKANRTQWSKRLQLLLQKKSKPQKFQMTWREIERSIDELPTFFKMIILIPKIRFNSYRIQSVLFRKIRILISSFYVLISLLISKVIAGRKKVSSYVLYLIRIDLLSSWPT